MASLVISRDYTPIHREWDFWIGRTIEKNQSEISFWVRYHYKPPFFHHVVGNSCAITIAQLGKYRHYRQIHPINGDWIDVI